jgi:hypothetical protein
MKENQHLSFCPIRSVRPATPFTECGHQEANAKLLEALAVQLQGHISWLKRCPPALQEESAACMDAAGSAACRAVSMIAGAIDRVARLREIHDPAR